MKRDQFNPFMAGSVPDFKLPSGLLDPAIGMSNQIGPGRRSLDAIHKRIRDAAARNTAAAARMRAVVARRRANWQR